jgi:D-alanine--poly(phosphoribitol) ligase subunit 1
MISPMYHYNVSLLFPQVAHQFTGRPALRYPDREVTYGKLLELAESLAALLLTEGCRRGDVIAIGHTKRPLSYALMLAALRLGVAYVNIDVTSPVSRTSSTLRVCGAQRLFNDDPKAAGVMGELAAACGGRVILLEEGRLPMVSTAQREAQESLMQEVDGATIAYIMFTSGSTGTPKGVAVTHQNVLHFMAWGQAYFGITEQDNFANLSPMYFDNSVFDFYVGLFSGACLTPVCRELLASPYELISHVGSMDCTIWFSVPSLLIYMMTMKAMVPARLPRLRALVFGGEGYPKVELKKLYDLFSRQAHLVNVYGPTECTCICSAYTLCDTDFQELTGLPTLGCLNPNFDYRIVDEEGRDAACGELCLIGPNVAAGYFNDLERTEASFHTITEPGRFMKRMYRTGDIVQKKDDRLHFIGRKDNQIKHMGYRIELEEIEHALVKVPHVRQAAVVYHRSNAAYGKLVGFVQTASPLDETAILADLNRLLPSYMIPSQIIATAELPKNPNGKVDRRKLLESLQDCVALGTGKRRTPIHDTPPS